LLAAIFIGLSYPVYQWVLGRLRGRKALAAIATLVLLLVLVMAPLLAVLGAGANEALRVSKTIRPRLERLVDQLAGAPWQPAAISLQRVCSALPPLRNTRFYSPGEIVNRRMNRRSRIVHRTTSER
jgi:predicted PurR-regulated permease PerM